MKDHQESYEQPEFSQDLSSTPCFDDKCKQACGYSVQNSNLEYASIRQSHANSLVSDNFLGNIRVFSFISDQTPGINSQYTWGEALNAAVDLWNTAGSNSCINFQVVDSPDIADILILGPDQISGGWPGGASHIFGWVDGNPFCGRPYPTILINTNFVYSDNSTPDDTGMINIIAHELGHAIGFRHVEDPTGIHIPGTPSNNDPNSVMTENIVLKISTDFSANDHIAIDYLYGCNSAINDNYISDQEVITITSVSPDPFCYTEDFSINGYFGTCDASDFGTIKIYLVEDGAFGVPVPMQIASAPFSNGAFTFNLNLSNILGFDPNQEYSVYATIVGSGAVSESIALPFVLDCPTNECAMACQIIDSPVNVEFNGSSYTFSVHPDILNSPCFANYSFYWLYNGNMESTSTSITISPASYFQYDVFYYINYDDGVTDCKWKQTL